MKKLLLALILVIALPCTAIGQDDLYLPQNSTGKSRKKEVSMLPIDQKNGFKMAKFGERVDDYRESLKPLVMGTDTIFQVIDPDYLKIGDIDIHEFNIVTTNGIIYAIMFKVQGHARDMKDIFIEAYGNRYETPNQFMQKYIWKGKKVALIYEYSEINHIVSCTMTGFDALSISETSDAIKNKERSKDI